MMVTIKKHFGLGKTVACDRCGKTISEYYDRTILCCKCFSIDPHNVRRHVIDKNSFLQLNTKAQLCHICQAVVDISSWYDVCYTCSSKHYDNSHSSFQNAPKVHFGNEPTEDITRIDYCFNCHGKQIITMRMNKQYEYTYYKVGVREGMDRPYICPNPYVSPNDVLHEEYRNRLDSYIDQCTHDWIKIYEVIKNRKEGNNKYISMMNNPVMGIIGLEKWQIERIAYGEVNYWCWKCGHYWNLLPHEVSSLPARGRSFKR